MTILLLEGWQRHTLEDYQYFRKLKGYDDRYIVKHLKTLDSCLRRND